MTMFESWPVWGAIVALEAILYLLWPAKLLKKNEYIMFFLLSFSTYWLLMLMLHIWLGGFHHRTPLTGGLFLTCLIPWISLMHLIYPFKTRRRNPQFTFLSLALTASALVIVAAVWVLVQFSNM